MGAERPTLAQRHVDRAEAERDDQNAGRGEERPPGSGPARLPARAQERSDGEERQRRREVGEGAVSHIKKAGRKDGPPCRDEAGAAQGEE